MVYKFCIYIVFINGVCSDHSEIISRRGAKKKRRLMLRRRPLRPAKKAPLEEGAASGSHGPVGLVPPASGLGDHGAIELREGLVPEIPAAHLADDGPVAPRAPRESRQEPWGVFKLAPIVSHGVRLGWGAVCGRHLNQDDGAVCKKQLRFCGLSDDHTKRLVKAWCLLGFDIDPSDLQARDKHRDEYPRESLPMFSDVELEEQLRAKGGP